MASIEGRRNLRNWILAAAIAGSAILLCAAVVLIIVFASKGRNSNDPEPLPDAAPSAAPFETDYPEAIESLLPSVPPSTEVPVHDPVRISDENSLMIVNIVCKSGTDEFGGLSGEVTGSCAVQFVNNTDSPLYSADFILTRLSVLSASLDGVPARFILNEDGSVTVPFLQELPVNASCEIFFEFEGSVEPGAEFAIPSFSSAYLYTLTMYIDSDVPLVFTGATPGQTEVEGRYYYSFAKRTVRAITAHFHF